MTAQIVRPQSPAADPAAGLRAAAGAISATVASVLPVFLVGGMSVLIGDDIGFDIAGLGIAVSGCFAVSALASLPAGWLVERYGPTLVTASGVALSAFCLFAIAALARSYPALLALLFISGAGNSLAQLGSNASLSRHVPAHRQGLSFGVKQAAVPAATLLAGVAVPAVGLTIGWRWAFVVAGALALCALLVVPREPRRAGARASHDSNRATAALVVIAVGGMFGAGTANALGSFLVDSAVDRGVDTALAGLTLSLGSVVGIICRVAGGWLADRRAGGHVTVVSVMLAFGAIGLALLAAPGTWALVVGTVLAFGLGWSWPGVLNFAVVRLNPTAPAAATSITQSGVYAGGAVGPLAFGALAHSTGYPTAWITAAGAMVVSAALMATGAAMLRRHLARLANLVNQ